MDILVVYKIVYIDNTSCREGQIQTSLHPIQFTMVMNGRHGHPWNIF